jgi:GR25 family glycosyltransferase involved in LPS biosynthesis
MEKYVDHIFYINLEHRKDRKEHIEKQIKEYLDTNLEITSRFNAIQYNGNFVNNCFRNKGAIGASLSHLEVAKLAKKNNYKNTLVLEDDIIFNWSKERFYSLLDRFFKNITDYNLLMFDTAGNQWHPWQTYDTNIPEIYKLGDSFCAGGYIISNNFLDTYIKHLEQATPKLIQGDIFNGRIDESWKIFQGNEEDKKVYTFNKPLDKVLHQISDYSDIEGRITNAKTNYPEC